MYPEAISIAAEMATYALVVDLIYGYINKKDIKSIYISLLISMVVGRVIRTCVQLALLRVVSAPINFGAFFSAVILAGIPGIIIQLIIVPIIVHITNNKLLD